MSKPLSEADVARLEEYVRVSSDKDQLHAARYANAMKAVELLPRLLEERDRLRAALEPFAGYAKIAGDGWPDSTGCNLLFVKPDGSMGHEPRIDLGCCRAARRALEGAG